MNTCRRTSSIKVNMILFIHLFIFNWLILPSIFCRSSGSTHWQLMTGCVCIVRSENPTHPKCRSLPGWGSGGVSVSLSHSFVFVVYSQRSETLVFDLGCTHIQRADTYKNKIFYSICSLRFLYIFALKQASFWYGESCVSVLTRILIEYVECFHTQRHTWL